MAKQRRCQTYTAYNCRS